MTMSKRFSHRTTVSARKPASFWQEKHDTVVILVLGFSSCQNKVKNMKAVLAFCELHKGSGTSNKNK